jgi:DNA-binding transcriptional LysR family regulator
VLVIQRAIRRGRGGGWVKYCELVVNPVHLKTLLEVTRLGSFAAAAATLGYTASAVSQQMSALERETGVTLFQRSARAVIPTEAAVVMTRHAA